MASPSPVDSVFTPEMRDRQARGRDPYDSNSDDGDWVTEHAGIGSGAATSNSAGYSTTLGGTLPPRVCAPKKDEPFAAYDRRRMAAQILDSPELLMMAAVRDDKSIPATRLKYTRLLCGLEEPSAPLPATETTASSSSSARQSPDKQQPSSSSSQAPEKTQQQQQQQQNKRTNPGRGGKR
ncbi:hypothetical protein F4861DRAFT_165763 [Xylaria intraflava]|nr:hypothetical protein F4861DRAFT_165763 [Xylaria intraflava]